MSLPAREAWIEMLWTLAANVPIKSLPAREAWIEISAEANGSEIYVVASREGSVD